MKFFSNLLGKKKPDAPMPAAAPRKRITQAALLSASAKPEPLRVKIGPPALMPGVVPAKREAGHMALDAAPMMSLYDYANQTYFGGGFLGYPFLSDLTQRSEYRQPVATLAKEMTRKWIKLHGKDQKRVERLNDELDRHHVRALFERAVMHDGFFGRAQIYIDIRDAQGEIPLIISPATVKKGSLVGFKNIEPIWTTPFSYNSADPMARDFYKPTAWYVLGRKVHASRLLTMISREVPDLLKPAYNFGGQSLSQLMIPYVDSWLQTRDSVSAIVNAFSISGIKTDISSALEQGGADDLNNRADYFNQMRSNKGLMILSNDPSTPEEFFQVNTPLSSLDHLQAQSQEHMSAPSQIPLVKLFGISPSGLNATSEGELTVFYDHIKSLQESFFADPLRTILDVIQLDVFGDMDNTIKFEFVPLEELNGTELAAVRKSDADAAAVLITAGVLSADEERARLQADPNSGYENLEGESAPGAPEDDAGDLEKGDE